MLIAVGGTAIVIPADRAWPVGRVSCVEGLCQCVCVPLVCVCVCHLCVWSCLRVLCSECACACMCLCARMCVCVCACVQLSCFLHPQRRDSTRLPLCSPRAGGQAHTRSWQATPRAPPARATPFHQPGAPRAPPVPTIPFRPPRVPRAHVMR